MLRIKLLSVLIIGTASILLSCESDSMFASPDSASGQGGSMTRFAINGNYLYIVSHKAINVFDIRENTFEKVNTVNVDLGLETIFSRGEYLYLGANDGMYIYSITNPENPTFIFKWEHIVSCDPVVVQGNRAYVTMRSGTVCNTLAQLDRLEILDIANPHDPTLIASYQMTSPYGLGVDQNLLFLCEGDAGLKVYDVSTATNIHLVEEMTTIHAYDVIPRNGLLQVTGDDGIFQFQYSGSGELELLSTIPVNRADQ